MLRTAAGDGARIGGEEADEVDKREGAKGGKDHKHGGQKEFKGWQEMDRELWTQVMRSEGDEVTSIIQSATEEGVVCAEVWRALKSRYDPETAITVEAWRGELFKVR